MLDLANTIAELGGDPTGLKLLDQPKPELLAYATLVGPTRKTDDHLSAIRAVYEWHGSPLLFLVDVDDLQEKPDRLRIIRRLLAMRGDAPYLGVAAPGRLTIYPIALDDQKSPRALRGLHEGDQPDHVFLLRLANKRADATLSNQRWISDVVLGLLTDAIDSLIKDDGIGHEDAISIVGRALFTRFLADRSLLPGDPDEYAHYCFDDADRARKTSEWLDHTFNGDLLPLSDGIFEALTLQGYSVLGDILRRAPGGQLMLGWKEKWNRLDFAHIPVGVLSQAYELYLRNHTPQTQRREGGYYTPHPISDLIVSAAFKGIEGSEGHRYAKVLDPAAGTGVFLLTAFRELVATEWRQTGIRPSTERLREILYGQITGFDINEAALRFGALGLYLIAIELDPNPQPVDKLAFSNLRGNVLHLLRDEDGDASDLGSLGPLVSDEHKNRYDIVIGNPPWAKGTKLVNWLDTCRLVSQIAKERGVGDASPLLPDKVLDLPFVWRAMEWAKPEGQIAFALHGRFLFQQGDGMPVARQAVFDALDVTSIINGSELSKTRVWPQIKAPFCLLFARNRRPTRESVCRFVSPHRESFLNASGRMRIDALNADFISHERLREIPEVFKILFRGSMADVEIIERLHRSDYPTIESYWHRKIGLSTRGRLRGLGNGYQNLRPSSQKHKDGDGKPGVDASYLHGLPDLELGALSEVLIDTNRLPAFRHSRIHDPRQKEIFSGPLLLVHQSPPAESERITTAVSDNDLAYNGSFYGYSPGSHPNAGLLVRYFALVLGSRLATWWALMTSGKFGIERAVLEKMTLDRMPVPDFDTLDATTLEDLRSLFDGLTHGKCTWERVDWWVAELYGLSDREIQTIDDTLSFSLPYAANQQRAEEPPSNQMQADFCSALREKLDLWCRRYGTEIQVREVSLQTSSPWRFISVSTDGIRESPLGSDEDILKLLRAADALAASEMDLILKSGCLLHARLAQARYWTKTQSRLYAQHIIWNHFDLLKAQKSA